MVCEIIQVEVRQCGNQIDNAVWNAMIVKFKFTKGGKFTGNNFSNKDDERRLDNTCIDNFVYMMKIADIYANRIGGTFSVYLSPKVSDDVLKQYNGILSIHELLENVSYNISHNTLKQQLLKYAQLNCDITASLRFGDKLNDLVVFGRLHFFGICQAHLFSKVDGKHIIDEMGSSRNFLANVKPEHGKYLSASRYCCNLVTQKMSDSFVTWTPK